MGRSILPSQLKPPRRLGHCTDVKNNISKERTKHLVKEKWIWIYTTGWQLTETLDITIQLGDFADKD
ncbi:hypothetical protein FRX31_015189 [Thalictrum thalictroides]|uniref:Uncharacterized protein n=1 Tax=Thalictrum thalictroides TaxID=46969 RepID=A0A7J6WGI5_THATH|nr:hypothetical protein FRX31_015189 [Thalictrum thalictroides]